MLALDLQQSYKLNETQSVAEVFGSPGALISKFLPQAYLFAGLIMFGLLVTGGFRIIMGAGDPKSIEEGKKTMTNALVGFGVIFTSYWVIQIIETVFGVKIFSSGL